MHRALVTEVDTTAERSLVMRAAKQSLQIWTIAPLPRCLELVGGYFDAVQRGKTQHRERRFKPAHIQQVAMCLEVAATSAG